MIRPKLSVWPNARLVSGAAMPFANYATKTARVALDPLSSIAYLAILTFSWMTTSAFIHAVLGSTLINLATATTAIHPVNSVMVLHGITAFCVVKTTTCQFRIINASLTNVQGRLI
jgi:hypothetical protein